MSCEYTLDRALQDLDMVRMFLRNQTSPCEAMAERLDRALRFLERGLQKTVWPVLNEWEEVLERAEFLGIMRKCEDGIIPLSSLVGFLGAQREFPSLEKIKYLLDYSSLNPLRDPTGRKFLMGWEYTEEVKDRIPLRFR